MAWYDKITKVFGNSEEKKKIAKREVIEETLTVEEIPIQQLKLYVEFLSNVD